MLWSRFLLFISEVNLFAKNSHLKRACFFVSIFYLQVQSCGAIDVEMNGSISDEKKS